MLSLTIKSPGGKDAGSVELDDSMFGVQPNVPLMHQVVTAQLAARRSGSASTKTRSEVRGGGAKPYRQKGTGNARQGSIRSPQFTGGGVAHGPHPRSFAQKTPKKMIKAALRSALSDRANDGKVVVVESWGIDSPRTKDAKQALDALGIGGTALIVLGADDTAAKLSFRNLPAVQVIDVVELNAYDVLCNDWIVFTRATLPTGPVASADDAGPVAKVRGAVADTASVVADAVDDATETARGAVEAAAVSARQVAEGVVESVKDVAEDVADAVTGDDDEAGSEAASIGPEDESSQKDES